MCIHVSMSVYYMKVYKCILYEGIYRYIRQYVYIRFHAVSEYIRSMHTVCSMEYIHECATDIRHSRSHCYLPQVHFTLETLREGCSA